MIIQFYKYQGTGNDFIIVDNRTSTFSKNDTKFINFLCDRKFGIGADGLILLENESSAEVDFKMVYFNADGKQSSMCGNGGRCIVAFAKFLNIIENQTIFSAIDGLHKAKIYDAEVSLKMKDVSEIETNENEAILDTGSPHLVKFEKEVDQLDVKRAGAAIRYSEAFKKEGINVNFVHQKSPNLLKVRTYERGVEDETLSCGTGVTAVAIAAHAAGRTTACDLQLDNPGGLLKVSFSKTEKGYQNIWLTGPAVQVFKGEVKK